MVTMFIDAFNIVQQQQTPTDLMRKKYDSINVIYGNLMKESLSSGGSPANAGEDVEREEKVYDRILLSVQSSNNTDVTNITNNNDAALQSTIDQLDQTTKSYSILEQKYELMQRNYKVLAQRAKNAGI
jgi:hypothetical protein